MPEPFVDTLAIGNRRQGLRPLFAVLLELLLSAASLAKGELGSGALLRRKPNCRAAWHNIVRARHARPDCPCRGAGGRHAAAPCRHECLTLAALACFSTRRWRACGPGAARDWGLPCGTLRIAGAFRRHDGRRGGDRSSIAAIGSSHGYDCRRWRRLGTLRAAATRRRFSERPPAARRRYKPVLWLRRRKSFAVLGSSAVLFSRTDRFWRGLYCLFGRWRGGDNLRHRSEIGRRQ